MKAILMSIRPEWVTKILNGEKTIEIRKKFPKGYVGWVYIYCTKNGHLTKCSNGIWYNSKYGKPYDNRFSYYSGYEGKVVARFWCDRVEEIRYLPYTDTFETNEFGDRELLTKSCLSYEDLALYLKGKVGKAIHITKVKPFDKPKEISEFRQYCDKHFSWWKNKCLDCKAYTPDTDIEDYCNKNKLSLTRAPQSWCYVEI